MIAIGRLLKSACDHHDLRGRKFVNFAMEHAKVKGKTDAYDLLKLGEIADTILADCEAKQRDNPDYFWPHWRNAIQGMKRQENRARRRDTGVSKAKARESKMDAISAFMRERDAARAETEAVTQRMRSERAGREEAEDECARLRARVADLESELAESQADNQKLRAQRPIRLDRGALGGWLQTRAQCVADPPAPAKPNGHWTDVFCQRRNLAVYTYAPGKRDEPDQADGLVVDGTAVKTCRCRC